MTILEFYQQASANLEQYVHMQAVTRLEFDTHVHETHWEEQGDLVGYYQGARLIAVYNTSTGQGYYSIK